MPTSFDYGTGRRKTAVARTRLYPGAGQIEVNGRPMEQYFPRKTLQMIVRQPLVLTATNNFDFFNAGRMYGEHTFDADAVRNSADSEHFAHAATLTTDNNALENLDTFAVAFNDFCVDTNGIAGCKLRNVFAQLFALNKFDDIQFGILPSLSDVRARTQRNASTVCKV